MPFLKDKSKLQSKSAKLIHLSNKNGLRKSVYNIWNDRYIGEWKDNVKEGTGVCLTRTRRLYEGYWKNDLRDGFGVLCWPKGNIFILEYQGEWRKGFQCGFGQKHYSDEGYYLGHLKRSKRHGHGQMWYPDGGYYIGDWRNDFRQGAGMWVRPDGNRYEGSWYLDLKHGKGRFFHLATGQMQEGTWEMDICVNSDLVDIPYRQCSSIPTPYPIPEIMLQDLDGRKLSAADENTCGHSVTCEQICK
ncbi:hypothetical protein PPYR_11794 [Photinus pyralis]|uniref:MORN repeat-containing protein 3 n=2 Tax=Photinus pyralis TaxID=7054 RepID=A0A5N4ACA4_PHOPY|nr:MORN repeat-containing protein 3-like [Photinus pyralis]KAB0794955.1 hypothetical protein PPYR_11794 [Photinus pyralis]